MYGQLNRDPEVPMAVLGGGGRRRGGRLPFHDEAAGAPAGGLTAVIAGIPRPVARFAERPPAGSASTIGRGLGVRKAPRRLC